MAVKLCLWTWARVAELASLRWSDLRQVGDECHFQVEGKMGVEKWARVPNGLFGELERIRTPSPYVLASYNGQLRQFYLGHGQERFARHVGAAYNPAAFADWFQERIVDWAADTGRPHATPHAFRKTAVQRAGSGEDINRQVADDARLGTSVMLKHFVTEGDEEHRQASNRMFTRLVRNLPADLAARYGHQGQGEPDECELRLKQALESKNWEAAEELLGMLKGKKR